MGIMTAIAIVAPLPRPPFDELLPPPEALRADRVEEAEEVVEDNVDASEAAGVMVTGACVE